MVKKYKLVLVMSIISFVLSAVSWYFYVINIGGFPAEIVLFHAITAILGVLGLISFFGKGKAAFGCLITAMVVSAGYTLISLVYGIADENMLFIIYMVYFCLYTAGLAVVYIKNKKDRNL